MRTKRIFLASSAELVEDRKEVEFLINRKNKDWVGRGLSLELVIWEDFLDVMVQARLQEEYNRVSREGDIFVMLFWNKLGPHTEEEFTKVFATPPVKRRPLVYACFKDVPITLNTATKADLKPMWRLQEQLQQAGHSQRPYKNTDALKLYLAQELDLLAADGFAAFDAADADDASHEAPPTSPEAAPAAASPKAPVPQGAAGPRRGGAGRLWISVALVVVLAAGAYGFMRTVRTEGKNAASQNAVVVPQAGSTRSKESQPTPLSSGAGEGAGDALGGQEVFAMACAVCHDSGVAGAPKMGDAAAWAPRIAQGEALLRERALQGYQGKDGFMPAKGGRTDLSDQAVINAVNHMVENSQ